METNNIAENSFFSAERFAKLAKYDFAVRKSNYIKLLIVALGVFIGMAVLVGIPAMSNINEIKGASYYDSSILVVRQQSAWYSYSGICLWILCVGLTVMGSLTFSSMASKRERITTLMIPASAFEKYLLNFLVYFVGGTLTLIIGFLLGSLVLQLTIGGGSSTIDMLSDFMRQVDYSGLIISILVLLSLWGNSLYALGSAFWPRLSWIKTWIVCAVVEWLIAVPLMIAMFSGFHFEALFYILGNGPLLLWLAFSLMVVLNVVCWIVAWYRYRNTQIVQRFMKK